MERAQTLVEGVGQVDTQEFLSVAVQEYGVPVAKLTVVEKARPSTPSDQKSGGGQEVGAVKTSVFEISKSTVTIGRKDADDGVDITIGHKVMSSRHMYLFIEKNGAVKLRDLNSRNKTFITRTEADGTTVSVQKECFPGRDYKVDPDLDTIEIGGFGSVAMTVKLLGEPGALGRVATGVPTPAETLAETQILPAEDDEDGGDDMPPPAADSSKRRATTTELAAPLAGPLSGGRGSATLASFVASPNLGAGLGSSASFQQPTPILGAGNNDSFSTGGGGATGTSTNEKGSTIKKVDFDVDATQDYGYSPVSGALPGGGPNALPATLMASSSDELLLEPVAAAAPAPGATTTTGGGGGGGGAVDPDATLTVQADAFGDSALGPTIIAPTLDLPDKAPPPQRRSSGGKSSAVKVKDTLSESDSDDDEVPPPLSKHSSRNALQPSDGSGGGDATSKAAAPLPRDEEVTFKFPVPPAINLNDGDVTEEDEPPSPTLAPAASESDKKVPAAAQQGEEEETDATPLGLLRCGTVAGKSVSSLLKVTSTNTITTTDQVAEEKTSSSIGDKRTRDDTTTAMDDQEDMELRPKAPNLRGEKKLSKDEKEETEGDEAPEPMACTDGLRKPAAIPTPSSLPERQSSAAADGHSHPSSPKQAAASGSSASKRAPPAAKKKGAKTASQESSEWGSDDEDAKKKAKPATRVPAEAKKAKKEGEEEKIKTDETSKKPPGKRATAAAKDKSKKEKEEKEEKKAEEDEESPSDSSSAAPVWQYKHDLRKKATRPEAWTDYGSADSATIEAGYQTFLANPKSRAKRIRECKVNAEYSVNFSDMIQFRNDDSNRQRDIRRKP